MPRSITFSTSDITERGREREWERERKREKKERKRERLTQTYLDVDDRLSARLEEIDS